MKQVSLLIISLIFFSIQILAQKEGDVIINEIGNGGTKNSMYTGGDYIELLVLKPEGVKLAGYYLTDLSSPTGTAKETEGVIKFSDIEGSVFNKVLPKGTYILICLGIQNIKYGSGIQKEITDGYRIVVFAGESNNNIEKGDGTIVLTGRDNIALLSSWNKTSAIDIVTWEGSSNWSGCDVTALPVDSLENGKIASFIPGDGIFANNSNIQNWSSASDEKFSTPGFPNKGVDDSSLRR